METANIALSLSDFKEKMKDNDTIILDTRPANVFVEGFIPDSIFIGLEGKFAEWAGVILPADKKILLVTEPGKEEETITKLAAVGFDKIVGYLNGGFESWKNADDKIDIIIDVEPDELAMDIKFDEKLVVLDVRKELEYDDNHIKDSLHIPLDNLVDPASMIDLEDYLNIYVHCAAGYRSVIASSLLKRQGIHNIRSIVGGFEKIKTFEKEFEFEKTTSTLN